ncbi:SRPBCC domain-containing protein [Lentzea sp. NPDC006480]|uniref:SRPBCC domain-containing protein n=1 Tax=Lentzea sp. NPDC006480 TaxID=3157176 RepID=UPI0033AD3854
MSEEVPDVSKSVTVHAPIEQAFAIFAEKPLEWWPPTHVFVKDRQSITIEPEVGGRYYETGADGEEIAWGTITEWNPPKRLVMTWRVGPGWRPIFDDVKASFIEVDFVAVDENTTEVRLTHAQLHRHGEIAGQIHSALDGPSPGETLEQFADVVRKHAA